MTSYLGNPEHDHRTPERTGVLLVNLGTPDAPDTGSVRRYLAEFLWDPRVIEAPRWLWWLILHVVILTIRPRRSAALYATVWTEAGSPLLVQSRRQAEGIAARLKEEPGGPELEVALAMRYGNPSIGAALEQLRARNVRRLVVLPLYPQYSATTTGSVFDAVVDVLKTWRWIPELRFITHYHDDPGYVSAVAASVEAFTRANGRPDRLLFSFHGLPRRYLDAGDPYFCHCHKTARLTAEKLGLAEDGWAVSFQSRVGREEWLRPYTDELLGQWGREGVRTVHVVCPGFAADCLETLEEIAITGREQFEQAGGETLHYIPALNDRSDHLDALSVVLGRRIGDWLGAGRRSEASREGKRRAARAGALGARR